MYKNTGTNATAGGEFQDGNVSLGIPRSILGSAWLNMMQREGLSLLAAAGITPDPAQFDQWTQAILALVGGGGSATLQAVYPVGSIYFTTDLTFDPHAHWGFGTWSKMPAGKYLVTYEESDSNFGTLGHTGGAASTVLVDGQMPDHFHLNGMADDLGGCFVYGGTTDDAPGSSTKNFDESDGGGGKQGKTSTVGSTDPDPVPTLSPYVVLGNAWKRTA